MEVPRHRQGDALRAAFQPMVCLLCFVLSFGLVCLGIGRKLPFPNVPTVRPKLDWLAAHGDEFDVLFVGSSRVQQQFMPSIFDRVAAEGGRPLRSFNAGIPAMVSPEDAYVIEQILRRPHRRLRWLVLELTPFGRHFDPTLDGTGRMDYWHDAYRMSLLTNCAAADCASAWRRPGSAWGQRYELCFNILADWCSHFRQFVQRTINFGRGEALLTEHLRGGRKPTKLDAGGPAGDGWVDISGRELMEGKMLAAYEQDLAELLNAPRNRFEDAVGEQSLRGTIDLLRRQGIELILFLPPTVSPAQFYPKRVLETTTLFDLSDPARYPDFYDPANRRDGVHLNLAGSALYTRRLALLFVEHTRQLPR
jgi:hypothetical protein